MTSCSVNLLGENAVVEFDACCVGVDELKEAIEDAGFEADLQPQVCAAGGGGGGSVRTAPVHHRWLCWLWVVGVQRGGACWWVEDRG